LTSAVQTGTPWLRHVPGAFTRALLLALLAFVIFGPLLNLLLWAFAEKWYFPSKLPLEYGFTFWRRVFAPRGNAIGSLGTSVWIALLTVVFSLAVAIPAGYALARLRLPWRGAILLAFLLPQAVPNLPVYVNIAQVFYQIGLAGTVTLPLAAPGLMASAIFVFLESLDEFTGTYFVGVPDVTTLPLLMFNASMGGNYQIASITALLLLVPSIGFMLVVERFLKSDVLAMVGR
jgi:putative spermidine/putrescine transport system permease protein